MKIVCKVKSDGSHYYASLPMTSRPVSPSHSYRSDKVRLFDSYFLEAMRQRISRKEIVTYIEERIRQERDISEWLSEDECRVLLKNKIRNIHKRLKRFENKLFLVDWNYFVTFTYDDQKETAASFEKRLKNCFSNFHVRKGWLVMGVPEEGNENGRFHYHCLLFIPDGSMVGELFTNGGYSKKRHAYETWTDNTYFHKRFGISVWKKIEHKDIVGGMLKSYLVKYLTKSENKIFYSRGIPSEIEMEIDTEKDVASCFYNYGVKMLLFDSLFEKEDVISDSTESCFEIKEDEVLGFSLDNIPKY